MQPSEDTRQHDRLNQNARPQRQHVRSLSQIERPDTTNQHVTNREVEQTPKNIHQRRGQTFPGRVCERTLESMPRNPIAEMG